MSNVIIAPSNATYHTDSGTHSVSNYSSNYSQSTADALSKYGFEGGASAPSSAMTSLANASSGLIKGSTSGYADAIRSSLFNAASANSALSQQYAMDSNMAAQAWSANEAQKNRDWQAEMSNTAHQREVKDLVAAGLNPILSANGGAFTGSGAQGQAFANMGNVDQAGSYGLSQMMNNILNNAANLGIAQLYNDTNLKQAEMDYASRMASTEASIMNAQTNAEASKYMADANAGAAKYGADLQHKDRLLQDRTNYQLGVLNAQTDRQIAEMNNNQKGMSNMFTNPVQYVYGASDLLAGSSSLWPSTSGNKIKYRSEWD